MTANFLPRSAGNWLGRSHSHASPEAASQPYRYLSRVIEREYPHDAKGVVLAFSCPDDDGMCTNVLLMQAYALHVELERPVLVIDARVTDNGGGVTQRLAMEEARGYAQVLEQGPVQLERLVQPSAFAGVSVLPRGGAAKARMLGLAANLSGLLAWAKDRYAYVLVQVGSVLADTRNLVTAIQADAVLLIAQENRTTMYAVEQAQDILRRNGMRDVRALMVAEQP